MPVSCGIAALRRLAREKQASAGYPGATPAAQMATSDPANNLVANLVTKSTILTGARLCFER
jgi:hypothetical protein